MTNYGKTKVKDLPVLISDKSIFCEGGGRLLSDIIYPVGSIYISVNSTNPSVYFGGSWEQIKDRFLLACGDTYNNGIFGGEAKHKLTVNEMPSHSHDMDEESYGGGGYKNKMGIRQDGGGSSHWAPQYAQTTSYSTYKPTYTGGGQAHNNMPPYFTVYIWKRTG
jgi:hypothetical protein